MAHCTGEQCRLFEGIVGLREDDTGAKLGWGFVVEAGVVGEWRGIEWVGNSGGRDYSERVGFVNKCIGRDATGRGCMRLVVGCRH